ncbi:hypothetical protein V2J09_021222 [Rumex salicifolius]
MTKSIKEEAVHKICKMFLAAGRLAVADLGCSSGPNTFLAVGELIRAVHRFQSGPVNITMEVFLNDLPGNDFNSVFKALPSFKEQLRKELGESIGYCFFHGVPGSFYDRLFHPNSLHFVPTSVSRWIYDTKIKSPLQWSLRRIFVPKGVGRSNKSNIYLSSESPTSVVEAYYKQFRNDFSSFLSYRSQELVKGGCMVFTLLGKSNDPSVKGSGFIWEPLSFVLHQMVNEGLINEENLDTFNIPLYTPSPKEIEKEVKKEGSFEVNCLQMTELDWEAANIAVDGKLSNSGLLKCMRSVAEPMLSHHFGQPLMDQVFDRYGVALADCMAKERIFFTNITVSLIKS